MNLEELIYKRFSKSNQLIQNLAVFSGKPAIFSPEAPEENQEGWERKNQYPQMIYSFDMQANQERKSVGTLVVNLFCQNTAQVVPEEIEPEVKNCLRDVLLKPESGILYAFTWARTDAFTMSEEKKDLIIGSEIRFDIHEYAYQETTDPDPIAAANQYIKALDSTFLVIGLDSMGEITEASKETPVIYCRLTHIEKGRETNTVAWMNGQIAVHLLCPDSEIRMKKATTIANQMSLDGEIIMLDHSPMQIKQLQANYQSDYLKEGQIFITVRYGLLRYQEKKHVLRKIKIEEKKGEQVQMAGEKELTAERTTTPKRREQPVSKQKDSIYTAAELADQSMSLFHSRKECVMVALKLAGVSSCTISEAKAIIEQFQKKEVK